MAMPPDAAERRPRREGGAPNDAHGGGNVSAIVTGAAVRCFTWRTVHGCGCGQAADCQLNSPLPFHPDQPCRGKFGDGGKWQPCCHDVA
jgi:hypothetical protein